MSLAGCQNNPIDVNFHLQKSLEIFDKNSADKIKFMATKIDEIFTVDLTLCSKCQIDGEDFVNFRGLLRKYEL